MARSRSPIAVPRSQLSIARWACSGEIARGSAGAGRPSGHGRHGGDDFPGNIAAVLAVAQERSQGGDDALEAGRPQMGHLAANEIDDVSGNDSAHIGAPALKRFLRNCPATIV